MQRPLAESEFPLASESRHVPRHAAGRHAAFWETPKGRVCLQDVCSHCCWVTEERKSRRYFLRISLLTLTLPMTQTRLLIQTHIPDSQKGSTSSVYGKVLFIICLHSSSLLLRSFVWNGEIGASNMMRNRSSQVLRQRTSRFVAKDEPRVLLPQFYPTTRPPRHRVLVLSWA